MRRIPPIDMHAHIEPDISSSDLLALEALVFAAT
jgi:TatD DNase family protein